MAVRWAPWALGVLVAVLALGPALGSGYVLRYDMVFVPEPSLRAVLVGADGFPRALPSDAVVAALSAVLPGDVVQSLALGTVFVLGVAGAFRLSTGLLYGWGDVPAAGLAAGAAAGLAYVWNPFVAERLLLGQWALLLGYAGSPWLLAAVARLASLPTGRGRAGVVCALLPAAVGGFSSVILSALTVGPTALRRWRDAGWVLAALVLVSLPWLVPSLTGGATTDPAGVAAFAARADTPAGTVGSLLLLGGVWNAGAVPPGYGEPVTVALRVLLVLVALAGWAWWSWRARSTVAVGLSVSALLGLAVALTGVVAPGFLVALIDLWPGFGPLRDGQLYVAPFALLQSLGLGAAVLWLLGALPPTPASGGGSTGGRNAPVDTEGPPRPAVPAMGRVGAVVFLGLLPVVVLPGLLWGARGGLAPVAYPPDWRETRAAVAADERPGAVLVLPWSAYRGPDWSGEPVVVLDPATKLFDRRTLWNDDLRVGTPDGETVSVTGEDTRAREAAALLDPDPDTGMPTVAPDALPGLLGALGVRYVVVSAPVDLDLSDVDELSPVVEGADIELFEVDDRHVDAESERVAGVVVASGALTLGTLVWAVIARARGVLRPDRDQGR
ncbi:hypothetical protein [Nocardiopsis sp. MG754419]|uniref:hypothetical protein n=1 Tax=Nocardiopsis sp. MG754419 TaxID=2259865 RepID=UPI001BA5A073|nr:hypothetical protein [Nocardiopsis sp. MG754419]MBR8741278.1 hypothetical protein [Nocardiopsis sp. MG754419]